MMHRNGAPLAQLGFHPAFRRLVTQLQPYLLVKTIDPLPIDIPALTLQQNTNTPVALAYPRLRDRPHPDFSKFCPERARGCNEILEIALRCAQTTEFPKTIRCDKTKGSPLYGAWIET